MAIEQYVYEIANQMGIKLSEVSVTDGDQIGYHGMNLLNICADGHVVKALVNKSEMETLHDGGFCDKLEIKILTAMSQLQKMLDK